MGKKKGKKKIGGVVADAVAEVTARSDIKTPFIDNIKEDLRKRYSGHKDLYHSLDKLRNYRKNNKDIILDEELGALIKYRLSEVDFNKNPISQGQIRELLNCLDSIGLDELPPNIFEVVKEFFIKTESSRIKSLVHFLVHCKNLGVFAKKDLSLSPKVQEVVEILSN